jgi:23S rRNA (guanosine2251-2'-O)-methyltransferase
VVVVEADRRKLDAMSRTHAHQGVIALAAVREYATVESILQAAPTGASRPCW